MIMMCVRKGGGRGVSSIMCEGGVWVGFVGYK